MVSFVIVVGKPSVYWIFWVLMLVAGFIPGFNIQGRRRHLFRLGPYLYLWTSLVFPGFNVGALGAFASILLIGYVVDNLFGLHNVCLVSKSYTYK
jgi:hypothetical protein